MKHLLKHILLFFALTLSAEMQSQVPNEIVDPSGTISFGTFPGDFQVSTKFIYKNTSAGIYIQFATTDATDLYVEASKTQYMTVSTSSIASAYYDKLISQSNSNYIKHTFTNLKPGNYKILIYGINKGEEYTFTLKGTILEVDNPLPEPSPISDPSAISFSKDMNYVATFTPMKETSSLAYRDGKIENYESANVQVDIQYLDGIGRPVQRTQYRASPSKKDILTNQEYIAFDLVDKHWLPAAFIANGSYFDRTTIMKRSMTDNSDQMPYSTDTYEEPIFKRKLVEYGPGQYWYENKKAIKTQYLINVSGDNSLNCVLYKIDGSGQNTVLNRSGNYTTGELYVSQTTDENGNISYDFKNKLGQQILTRQINRDANHDTYYVYDDFGNLRFVLPPRIQEEGIASATLNELAYLYKYDYRNRCVYKKLPGCEPVYYIYDRSDRPIFTQDGIQRGRGEWSFSIPDAFGRIVLMGTCTDTISVSNKVIKAEYATDGMYKGYSIKVNGITKQFGLYNLLLVSYYDNYDFLGKNNYPSYIYDSSREVEGFGKYYNEGKGYETKGLLTGTITTLLSAGNLIYTTMYYDNRARLIQTHSSNHLGGKELEYIAYNFTNKTTKRMHLHSDAGGNIQKELYTYAYDDSGRLKTVKHSLNGSDTPVTLVNNEYDELGRLKAEKRNGQTNLITNYTYNVRSWLKSLSLPLFSQTLYYNDIYGGSTPCYNGNISAMSWSVGSEGKTRGYAFAYDNLSRLTAAGYLEGGSPNSNFTTSYAYDKQGNMTSLIRRGNTGTSTYGIIDNLAMAYSGNQLVKTEDTGSSVSLSASMDFKNNSNMTQEYFYDANGNLTKDLNKGITGITYNLLNLPQSVAISNTLGQATNTYIYAADGRKLRTVQQWSSTNSKQTDYVGNVIYESVNGTATTLKRILVDGGYIEGGVYYFYLTDHLGNNRVVANASGGIVQTNHYYPFGMPFAEGVTTSQQPYKYNGKELDTERGLNLYDYSARLMDPALGRFSTVDPLAEKYYGVSPYVYCGNNPVNRIDLDGKEWEDHNFDFYKETPDYIKTYNLLVDRQALSLSSTHIGSQILSPAADGDKSRTKETLTTGLMITGVLAGDDATGVGVVDDIAIPFVWAGVGAVLLYDLITADHSDVSSSVLPYYPPPLELPGFPGAERIKNKGRTRWKLPNGDIGEWDSQHGEVEVYDKTGKKHKGAYDPKTGQKKKEGKPNRKTEK
ncbi:MAG: hypothetical protein H6Q13_2458 [Bacteroidetes bacterium]|nr:hypothetical protein [Bacteroidota bacterium]